MSSSILTAAIRAAKGATLVSFTTSLSNNNTTSQWTSCESHYNTPNKTANNLTRKMTSIGRFSHDSETQLNPSVPTLFLAMSGTKPFRASDFIELWKRKELSKKYPRFEQRIDRSKPGYFIPTDKTLEECVTDTMFPQKATVTAAYRKDLAYRIMNYLMEPLQVYETLWEAQVCSGGEIGTSGAISQYKAEQILSSSSNSEKLYESLVLFRSHHAMADGTSLASGLLDLCNEAAELKSKIKMELKKRSGKARTLLQKLSRWIKRLLWFYGGILQSVLYQIMLVWYMPQNPFEVVLSLSSSSDAAAAGGENGMTNNSPRRTVSWCDAASVAEVKEVAQALGRKVTINDIWVSCAAYAISKQLEQHRGILQIRGKTLPVFPHINVIIPVHLTGGVLLPNQSMGNMIGAFAARLPGEGAFLDDRLAKVHDTLSWIKRSPSALISYLTVRSTAVLPVSWTKYLFSKANGNACAAISNVRGSPQRLHIGNQTIESMAGFLPLPPGIPIGVIITSYAGTLTLTVAAQPWAVPDADQFLLWMLEDYQRLLVKTGVQKK